MLGSLKVLAMEIGRTRSNGREFYGRLKDLGMPVDEGAKQDLVHSQQKSSPSIRYSFV